MKALLKFKAKVVKVKYPTFYKENGFELEEGKEYDVWSISVSNDNEIMVALHGSTLFPTYVEFELYQLVEQDGKQKFSKVYSNVTK